MRKSPWFHASSLLPTMRYCFCVLSFPPFHLSSLLSGAWLSLPLSFLVLHFAICVFVFIVPWLPAIPAPLRCLCRFWTVWLFQWHLWLQTALSYLSPLCFWIPSSPKHPTDTVSLIIAGPGHPAQLGIFTITILTVFFRALVLWSLFTVCRCDTHRVAWRGCNEEIISSSLCNEEKSLPTFLTSLLFVCVCLHVCCRTRVQTTVSGWTWACGTSSASWPLSALSRSWNLPNECLDSRGWPSQTRSRSWKLPAWTFWWVWVLLFWMIKLGV